MEEGSENGERRKGKERGKGISKKNVGRGSKETRITTRLDIAGLV
jgi:hypothetical protein